MFPGDESEANSYMYLFNTHLHVCAAHTGTLQKIAKTQMFNQICKIMIIGINILHLINIALQNKSKHKQ
jgi:hypothetical protein